MERLGRLLPGSPDYHGQTVQMFWGCDNIIFRGNIWEANEGQSLIAYGADGHTTSNVRFYGNVIFTAYGRNNTAGFNSSGGLIGDAWIANSISNVFIYNNTIVNQRASFTTTGSTHTHFRIHGSIRSVSNVYGYNNLFFNSRSSSAHRFTEYGYNASGGYGIAGGTNEQTGLTSDIFGNYTGNDFTLASATRAGLVLTNEWWWNEGPESFFGRLDCNTDLAGHIRGADGTWDRGAYEYVDAGGPSLKPSPPTDLRIDRPTNGRNE